MKGKDYLQQAQMVQPKVTVNIPEQKVNYWWALTLVVLPVLLAWYLRKRK